MNKWDKWRQKVIQFLYDEFRQNCHLASTEVALICSHEYVDRFEDHIKNNNPLNKEFKELFDEVCQKFGKPKYE